MSGADMIADKTKKTPAGGRRYRQALLEFHAWSAEDAVIRLGGGYLLTAKLCYFADMRA
ncbi:hypothetical protein LAL4801_00635 [Roseibium aggregatum]|uniref:Uncharacterized protein n=1 Tax=Roseibium aggregatum TaxID=187304 RepID=A0A0M6XZK7_9HYPH|nr:hypothetical protein LAL4801_00635 [Roseibium aggregatum]